MHKFSLIFVAVCDRPVGTIGPASTGKRTASPATWGALHRPGGFWRHGDYIELPAWNPRTWQVGL